MCGNARETKQIKAKKQSEAPGARKSHESHSRTQASQQAGTSPSHSPSLLMRPGNKQRVISCHWRKGRACGRGSRRRSEGSVSSQLGIHSLQHCHLQHGCTTRSSDSGLQWRQRLKGTSCEVQIFRSGDSWPHEHIMQNHTHSKE